MRTSEAGARPGSVHLSGTSDMRRTAHADGGGRHRTALFAGLLVLVLGASPATSAPDLPDRTAAWLRSLGIPAPDPRIVVIGEGWTAEAMALPPDTLGVKRDVVGPLRKGGAGEILVHELIHLSGTEDEGITQAVTLDLLPAWQARFPLRGRVVFVAGVMGVYVGEVRAVRQASARACGCPWTSRAARLWRRSLVTGSRG